jgi:hypothetical protein
MHRVVPRLLRGVVAFALLIVCLLALPVHAAPHPAGVADGIVVAPDGSMTLARDAFPAPAAFGGVGHFGVFVSETITYAVEFDTLHVEYTALLPRGAQVAVDVRASVDGVNWTPWVVDLTPQARSALRSPGTLCTVPHSYAGNRIIANDPYPAPDPGTRHTVIQRI